jgi:hypothetical protein
MATRNTFVAANSQHRPEEAWFVTGVPSSGILILNFCSSEMTADRFWRTALAEFELRAARARRFLASSSVESDSTYSVTHFRIFHELLLPLLHCRSGNILLMPGNRCIFGSLKESDGWTIRSKHSDTDGPLHQLQQSHPFRWYSVRPSSGALEASQSASR